MTSSYLLLQDKSLQSLSSDKESLVELHWKDRAAELPQDYCFSRSAASPGPTAAYLEYEKAQPLLFHVLVAPQNSFCSQNREVMKIFSTRMANILFLLDFPS